LGISNNPGDYVGKEEPDRMLAHISALCRMLCAPSLDKPV